MQRTELLGRQLLGPRVAREAEREERLAGRLADAGVADADAERLGERLAAVGETPLGRAAGGQRARAGRCG